MEHLRKSAQLNFNRTGVVTIFFSIWPPQKYSNTINFPKIYSKCYVIYGLQGILTQKFKMVFGNSKSQTFQSCSKKKSDL